MSKISPTLFLLLFLGGLTPACGGSEPEPEVPIARESPSDQIFRVGRLWESRTTENGFRTLPSPIATFSTQASSRLAFEPDAKTARETLAFRSTFKLQDGRGFSCEAETEVTAQVRFADHAGEAAVEVARPALRVARRCSPDGFPDPVLEVPVTVARFALRGDRLVAFAPAAERREYLPVQ